MHLESAETDLTLPAHHPGKPATARDTEGRPLREGLPAAFKMRHGRHYVEQLMGDAPLRTVREIALADIEPPEPETVDVDELQRSIQDVGILQPLLVTPVGGTARAERGPLDPATDVGNRYRIIAGANRYRAAVRLKLRAVPCLVCETGGHTVETLKEAAARRAAPPVVPDQSTPTPPEDSRQSQPAAGLRDVTERLAFVSAVMPALDVAGYDPLRWNILTDLMKVEMEQARSIAAAVEWLSSPSPAVVRETLDAAAVLDAVLEAVGPEARLKGIKLDVTSTLSGYFLPADRTMLMRALTGLLQNMLALSRSGSTLHVNGSGTAVRPAFIVAVTQTDCEVGPAAADRFFEPDFARHPNGVSGALVLGGVARAARLHGGRVHARAHDQRGCTATFIIPKPLGDV